MSQLSQQDAALQSTWFAWQREGKHRAGGSPTCVGGKDNAGLAEGCSHGSLFSLLQLLPQGLDLTQKMASLSLVLGLFGFCLGNRKNWDRANCCYSVLAVSMTSQSTWAWSREECLGRGVLFLCWRRDWDFLSCSEEEEPFWKQEGSPGPSSSSATSNWPLSCWKGSRAAPRHAQGFF